MKFRQPTTATTVPAVVVVAHVEAVATTVGTSTVVTTALLGRRAMALGASMGGVVTRRAPTFLQGPTFPASMGNLIH
jgi:hypothetical protein